LQFDVKGLLLNGHHESFSKLILPLDRTEQRGVTVDDLSFTTVLRCSNGMVQEGDRIRVHIRAEGEMQGGDRRSELDGEPSDVPTRMEPLKDAVCKILPILRIDDNGKLIPAIPEHLPLRNQLVQVLCDSFQQEIATTLPIGVVHSLEIVEADNENQRLPVVSANLVDTGDETTTVRVLGEKIDRDASCLEVEIDREDRQSDCRTCEHNIRVEELDGDDTEREKGEPEYDFKE